MNVSNTPYTATSYKNGVSNSAVNGSKAIPGETKAAHEPEKVIIPVKTPELATPCGSLVNYRDLLSRSKPLMSDERFMEAARELARKDFSLGIRADAEFSALRDAFLSVVSPDRVGLVENTFGKMADSLDKRLPRNLLEVFMMMENELGDLPQVSNVTVTPTGKLASINIHDDSGNVVVMYSYWSGWTASWTPEEWQRHHKILGVYNDEWYALHNEAKRENNRFELIQNDIVVGAYDALA
jgi:hypothetical protein